MDIYTTMELIDPKAYVGVDAITFTTTTELGFLSMRAIKDNLLPELEAYDTKPFRTNGASGFSKGPLRYAEKVTKQYKRLWAILMMTGPKSSDIVAYGNLDLKTTRVDFRVDVKLREPTPDLASRYYRVMCKSENNAKLIVSATGETLYPDANREATYYARLYDKSTEYGEAIGTIWRYEIEVKRQSAQVYSDILIECYDPELYISQTVFGVFSEKWKVPVPRKGVMPQVNYVGLSYVSNEQKLDWIRRNVAPSVKKLQSLGLSDELLDALGVKCIKPSNYNLVPIAEREEALGI